MVENNPINILINSRLRKIETPAVMGILNITPDSFHHGSRVESTQQAVDKAGMMLEQGAAMLDLGGMSTRPGSVAPDVSVEMERVIPAIEAIRKAFPECIISIDSYRAEVADAAMQIGADMINDIGAGLWDENMQELMLKHKVPVIIMHTRGKPEQMQQNPQYEHVVTEAFDFLISRKAELNRLGLHDIWIDPGFGFGKTLKHNYELLAGLEIFKLVEAPLLVGLSRKSMATRLLGISAQEALNATTALHMAALQKGAKILRVHDVKEAMDCIRIFRALTNPDIL